MVKLSEIFSIKSGILLGLQEEMLKLL